MMQAQLRTRDERRMLRLLLGWLDADKLAIDTALTEADEDDDGGLAGLLFAMTRFAAQSAHRQFGDDTAELFRAVLLENLDESEGGGEKL